MPAHPDQKVAAGHRKVAPSANRRLPATRPSWHVTWRQRPEPRYIWGRSVQTTPLDWSTFTSTSRHVRS